jgi:hypothetical protein
VEKRKPWEWLERTATLVGLLLGVTAFVWQLQERAMAHRESFVAVAGFALRDLGARDSCYRISVDLVNTGGSSLAIRYVFLQSGGENPNAFSLDGDSTMRAFTIEPNKPLTLKSESLDWETVTNFADSGYIEVETFHKRHHQRLDTGPLSLAVAVRQMEESVRRMGSEDGDTTSTHLRCKVLVGRDSIST